MLSYITANPVRAFFSLWLILLMTSCSETPSPTQESFQSNISQEQNLDWRAREARLAPGQQLRFETISLEDGLSQSTVFCILQDSQGLMWFGTEDGLNKYDGYEFTIYKPDPEDSNSLSVRWIQTLFEDNSGTLWVGTRDGGLSRFNRAQEIFIHYRNDPNNPDSLSNDNVTTIYQGKDGMLWIGTDGGGINRFDPENETFIHYQHDPDNLNSLSSNAISAIYEDQEGTLWVGTGDGGLNKYDPDNEQWQHFGNDPSFPDSLTHSTITALSEDQSGMLWVGMGGGGLVKFDSDTKQFIHYHHNPDDPNSLSSDEVMTLYHDLDGGLWIGTYGSGLNRFDPEMEIFSHFKNIPGNPSSLSQDTVLSIFQDREGVLWFGTIGGGANKLNNTWRNFALFQNNPDDINSLSDNMVRMFYYDHDDVLWVGSMFGGLDRFDRQTRTWHHYRHDPDNPDSLSNDFVSYIYKDCLGVLWIGTANGLNRFNPESDTFTLYQPEPDGPPGSLANNVRVINEFQTGKFLIGSRGGLYQFDLQDESWSQTYLHDSSDPSTNLNEIWVLSILEDRQGMIWIGTAGGGLFKFDPEKELFTRYQNDPGNPNSLSNNVIVSPVLEDREGKLWIGNLSGLDKFDPETETFTSYRKKDGLPNETIYCIVEDTVGNLWVSTNGGLSRFDPTSDTFRNYDVSNGLQSNEFNSSACLVNDKGEMFFGGINGFNVFMPDRITKNTTPPPIVLTNFSYGDDQVNLGHTDENLADVVIKWPDNAFEFEFAALSFAHAEKNQYAYYLDGFEDEWNQVGTRRYGQYTNLPGGTYTLKVKGSNNDDVWNELGTALEITVVPPFWAARWFQGILILALVGGAYGIYRMRVRNLEIRERDLAVQVKQRTNELIETQKTLQKSEMEKAIATERNRLARELHDSVTQSLYSLTLFSEAARHLADEQGLANIEQQIRQIGVIGLQALKEMRLLVYELQPPELERDGLVHALRRRLDAVEGRAGVEARVEVEEFVRLPGNIEQELFRIAQEALNNALKHAAASTVIVRLHQENDRIEMEIIDDGAGFEQQSLPDRGGMGLKSIRERADQLGGELEIHTNPGEGTRIKISIDGIIEEQQRGESNE